MPASSASHDRNCINVHDADELEYWQRTLGVTPKQLLDLVIEHGTDPRTIRAALCASGWTMVA